MPKPARKPAAIDPPHLAEISDPAEEVLADCLARPEHERASAIEDACAQRPELASELRLRLHALRAMGIELGESRGFPEQLGDFRLIERLGGGGMGVVYLAVQTSLQRDVALKLIRPEQLFFPGARARFRREAEAVARLQHPGIVPIYAVGEHDGIPYFAMELVRGCTLGQALRALGSRAPESLRGSDLHAVVAGVAGRSEPLAEGSAFDASWVDACLRIARQVAEALQHAHERGLVHRDVKPSNVVLAPDGRALLLDFGLTRAEDGGDMTRTGSAMGTLHYMSPEQLRAGRNADARSDVYSLGVTLYEMLTLQVPYRSDDPLELQRLVLDGRPDPIRPRNRRVDGDVETVVLRALDLDPARRYATAADFARDLGHLLAHRPIEARRPGALLRARRWFQRHPAAASAVVFGPALVLAATAVVLVQEKRHSRSLADTLEQTRAARDGAQRESERAGREARTAQRALDFVGGLLSPASSTARGTPTPPTTLDDILEHGALTVEGALAEEPAVRARVLCMLGCAFERRFQHVRAAELLAESCALWRADPSPEAEPYLAEGTYWLGTTLYHLGRIDESRALLEESLERWPLGEAGEGGRAKTLEALLLVRTNPSEIADTEAGLREALRVALERPETDAEEVARLQAKLGYALVRRGAFDEAASTFELACNVLCVEAAEPDMYLVNLLANFSQARAGQGRLDEALELSDRALELARAIYAPRDHPIGILLTNRGPLMARRGDVDAALRDLHEAAAIFAASVGAEHMFTRNARALIAQHASQAGRCGEAEEAACEIALSCDPSDPSTAVWRGKPAVALARCAELQGDRSAAERWWGEAARWYRLDPARARDESNALARLALLRLEHGATSEARVLLLRALDVALDSGTIPRPVLEGLARVCRAEGRAAEATSYASRMEE